MKRLLVSLAAVIAVVAAVALLKGGSELASGQTAGEPHVLSVLGVAQVQGEDAFVDVWVVVPPGQDERAAADAALSEQGARPANPRDLQSADFMTSGLVWDQFFDSTSSNDYVTQYYNSSGDPTAGNGETALTATHATWTNVATSSFAFQYGGQTDRCPSLVRECKGPQVFDGYNDVGWLPLSGSTTLGVTWYSTSTDEADMALNTKFGWHAGATSCTNVSGEYDAETVFLHENGHVVGLGHSDVPQAVMYAYYSGERCQLHQDDIDGISSLYPTGGAAPTPTPTPPGTPPPADTPTATPTSQPSGNSVSSISLELAARGSNYQATAYVTVVDGNGNTVKSAPVSGDWFLNGSLLNSGSGTANGRGVARLSSDKAAAVPGDNFAISITEPTAGILQCSATVGASTPVTCS